QVLEGHLDRRAQQLLPPGANPLFPARLPEFTVTHQLDVKAVDPFLTDPVLLDAFDFAQRIDQREGIDNPSVRRNDRVVRTALNPIEEWKRTATCALTRGRDADVSGRIADERRVLRVQVGDDDFAWLSRGYRASFRIEDLHDHRVGEHVHPPRRALVRDESAVP